MGKELHHGKVMGKWDDHGIAVCLYVKLQYFGILISQYTILCIAFVYLHACLFLGYHRHLRMI